MPAMSLQDMSWTFLCNLNNCLKYDLFEFISVSIKRYMRDIAVLSCSVSAFISHTKCLMWWLLGQPNLPALFIVQRLKEKQAACLVHSNQKKMLIEAAVECATFVDSLPGSHPGCNRYSNEISRKESLAFVTMFKQVMSAPPRQLSQI